jgi:hypothetical protein
MGRGGERQISNCSRVLPELLKADASSTAASGARHGTSNQRWRELI